MGPARVRSYFSDGPLASLNDREEIVAEFKELRVHGVSGTSPRDMLYTDPLPRAADPGAPRAYTTVYRKPQRDSEVEVEAFHWGGLTAGSWRTAFWILLAPFVFANISGWMADRQNRLGRAGVRVAGLTLTSLFVSQVAVVLVDMPYHWLSGRIEGIWLRVTVLALFVLFGFLFFLLVQKASTQSHFPPGLSTDRQLELILDPNPATMLPDGQADDTQWEDPAGATLSDPVVWLPHAILHRLRRLHFSGGIVVIGLTAARATSRPQLQWALIGLGLFVIVLTVATTFAPTAKWVRYGTAWSSAVAIAGAGWSLVVLGFSDLPGGGHWTGVHELTFHIAIVMFAASGFILFAGLASLGAFTIGAQLGGAFGLALAFVAEQTIGVHEVRRQGAAWTAVAMLLLTVFLVCIAAALSRPWDKSGLVAGKGADGIGKSHRLMAEVRRITVASRLVFQLAAVFAIVVGVSAVAIGCVGYTSCSPFNLGEEPGTVVQFLIIGLAALAVLLVWWTAHRIYGGIAVLVPLAVGAVLLAMRLGFHEITILKVTLDFSTLVGLAVALAVLLPGSFIVTSLIGGFRDAERRRKVGILWDVASFFSRWYHPLAPPSYGPIVVQKLRAELETGERDVLSAHSQGAMIAVVTLGQMETGLPSALLTYGCQLGLHYPAHFPTAGIAELVESVREKLGEGQWVNLWRVDDPLGGPVGGTVVDDVVDEAAGHSRYEVTDGYQTARGVLL